jgi:ABC-2 type transport system ATP-binding protein
MALLEAVGLADKSEAYVRALSGGMKRRLMVAKAMVHNPPVLVLDEPTAGVDIELRQHLWAAVRAMNERGTTILLTTHYLEEAEQLCDRIAIIHQGRLAALDTTANLLKRIDGKTLSVTLEHDLAVIPAPLVPFSPDLRDGRRLVIRYRPSAVPVGRILDAIAQAGLSVADLSTEETDLEDIFLQLVATHPH